MRKLLTLACIMIVSILHAQKVTIQEIVKPLRTDFGAIKEGSDVKGYYFFWASDKIDKNTYEWTLRFTDATLNTLKEVKMQESKKTEILETSFNGTDLILLMYDGEERMMTYQVYGADGKKKYTYTRQLTKKEERFLSATYFALDDEDGTFKGLYPVDNQGFISNMPSREDKDYTFQIDYFGTDKRKQWTYIPSMDGKKFVGDYLGTFNNVVYVEVLKYSGMMDGKPESSIIGLNLETGKQLFERPTDGKYRFYPASMSSVNGKGYVFGEYFDVDGNIMKDKSLGFAFWSLDEKGKITSEKYLSWDLQLGKYLDVSSKGKIDKFGFVFLHQMIQTSDGDVYAIGEGFRKQASALGIASKVLSGGRGSGVSAIKVQVTDMILIKFDKDFNVKDAKIYEKNNNNIELRSGMEFVSTPLLGKMIKYNYSAFDYAYTQTNKDVSSFTVAYADFVRGKDYRGSTFNSISLNDGKITTDRINTKSDTRRSWVLPSTQGSILIIDLYKKDNRLEGHVEKFN